MLDIDGQNITEICDALARFPRFKKTAKGNFAYSLVVNDLDHLIMHGQDNERVTKQIGKILKHAEAAEKALTTFYAVTREARGFASYQNLNAVLGSKIGGVVSVPAAIRYFKEYREELAGIRIPAKRQGRKNVIGLEVAKAIALRYKQYFKEDPVTGKGRKTIDDMERETAFDAVCKAIAKIYGISLTYHVRIKSIESIE